LGLVAAPAGADLEQFEIFCRRGTLRGGEHTGVPPVMSGRDGRDARAPCPIHHALTKRVLHGYGLV
jgi:hypothetical protein